MIPNIHFTIEEAIKEYAGDPFVRCLSDEQVIQINSHTIHSEKEAAWPEPWLWAYSLDSMEIPVLLYAPGHFNVNECIKADIIEMEGGDDESK